MSTIQLKGEPVRKAVKWISDARNEGDKRPVSILIEEAGRRYNLSPKDEDFLRTFYKEKGMKEI